jgi:methionyl-tRNA formyltransferase
MRAVLVSRYPRVDTTPWKRTVGEGLLNSGIDVALLYSQSTLLDQARAGVREEGVRVARRYLVLRRARHGEESAAPTLAAWARERGLQVEYRRRLADPRAARHLRPDVLVLVGADIVPESLLSLPRLGTVNAHYGLLPEYRGMNVTEWSVYRGAPVGVSVHLVDAGIDTGPILLREAIALEPGETFATLRRKHQELAARLLVRAVCDLRDGTARPVPQRASDGRQYYRMHRALRREAEARLRAQAGARGG